MLAAICDSYGMESCNTHIDGGCKCTWDTESQQCKKSTVCSGDGPTATNSGNCVLDNGTEINEGSSIPGEGENWCNTCTCVNGSLMCTEIGCGNDMTCGHVKALYKENGCCGNPNKAFHLDTGDRRLSSKIDSSNIIAEVSTALQTAISKGQKAKAIQLARQIEGVLASYTKV